MNKFLNLNLDIIQKSKVKSQNDKSKFKMNFIENFTFYNVILRVAFFSILNIGYLMLLSYCQFSRRQTKSSSCKLEPA